MPFPRPTLEEIIERIRGDIDAFLPGADSRLKRSVLDVLAIAYGGAVHLLYGFIAFLSRQLFVDQAETELLDQHAAFWNVPRLAAVFADGPVRFTGVNGTDIPAGTEISRSDGQVFLTDILVTVVGGQADVIVFAETAGIIGNTLDGTTLSLVSPISGIDAESTVITDAEHADGIDGGVDEESDESLRARILLRIRTPPQGGAVSDYEQQAKEVPGVTRVFVRPLNRGLGTVDVFFTRDNDVPIIPDSSEVQEVQDHIDPLKPVTADFLAIAPIALDLDVTLKLEPNTTVVQDAVKEELEDLLFREAAPGDGSGVGTIFLSQIGEAISIAAGEIRHEITVINGVSPADVVPGGGELLVLGTTTFLAF